MSSEETLSNCLHFKCIMAQLEKTAQYVDHSRGTNGWKNGKTNSIEFEKILLLSCSEFEMISKSICDKNSISLSCTPNIVDSSKGILGLYPKIVETEIQTRNGYIYKPLANWCIAKDKNNKDCTKGLGWWNSYNKIKHNRLESFRLANLENSINAVASLLVLELYYAYISDGNIDGFNLGPDSYFRHKYSRQYREINGSSLPDFEKRTNP